jgi:hypothetical protein
MRGRGGTGREASTTAAASPCVAVRGRELAHASGDGERTRDALDHRDQLAVDISVLVREIARLECDVGNEKAAVDLGHLGDVLADAMNTYLDKAPREVVAVVVARRLAAHGLGLLRDAAERITHIGYREDRRAGHLGVVAAALAENGPVHDAEVRRRAS